MAPSEATCKYELQKYELQKYELPHFDPILH